LPLAIELAAAWARLVPPPALLARLDRRLPLLIDGPPDLPARQRTMRGAIAWSYDLLDAAEQRLFRRFAVFAGGCTLEAAEAVCAGTAADPPVLTGLAALVDKSLLRRQDDLHAGSAEPRLIMLETLREYGLEQLAAFGEEHSARERHVAHYLALAEAAAPELSGPGAAAWGARLEREHDNLRAALRWVLDQRDEESALRLTAALWRFWSAHGHLGEGRRWLREALATTGEGTATTPTTRAKALAGAALLAIEQADFDEAAQLCTRAITLARASGSQADLIVMLNAQGQIKRERDQYQEAARDHEEARTLAEALGDRAGAAAALTGLAYAATFAGDAARGQALAAEGLALLREVGDARALAEALVGASAQAQLGGDLARAEALATEAMDLFRALGDTGRMAESLFVLGISAQMQGRREDAVACYGEGLALSRGRGDDYGLVKPLTALALIALDAGDSARARVLLDESAAILPRHDDRWSQAILLALLGQVELVDGDLERAQTLLRESVVLHLDLGNPLSVPWCLEGLARLAAARRDWERAARLCGALDALRARLGQSFPLAHPVGYAATIATSRAALGDDSYAAARAAGEHLSPEQALAAALATMPNAAP
jgi:hypothetical protein